MTEMKVRLEIDNTLQEPEVIIKASNHDPNVEHIKKLLENSSHSDTLTCYQGATEYFLKLDNILFIETADRRLQVHTKDDIYISKNHLYKLADSLPGSFLQVSKSALVNLYQVNALTKSISNCLISFRNSHKQIYASRRYYKQLQERLNEMR
ncbi:response regulator [Pediococcus ethanolidurans]|uniref:Response regulator n=2 Tax=Pediococcus ethanolidurans TaxID=319653 RepID=A0A0R2K5R3_9LACO|nr:response regulator [Pediococcus ethanolidurans]